jgi:glutathione S-transferase
VNEEMNGGGVYYLTIFLRLQDKEFLADSKFGYADRAFVTWSTVLFLFAVGLKPLDGFPPPQRWVGAH